MRLDLRLIVISAIIALVLPAVYGMTDCEDAVDIPRITLPTQWQTIDPSGVFALGLRRDPGA